MPNPLPNQYQDHVDIDDAAAALTEERASDLQKLQELGLRLPQNFRSAEFAEGLKQIREGFKPGERTLYNHLVCEELARRGEPPNSNNVLKYGAWGASVAVAADVRSWYAGMARNIAARQADIPDGARRQANELLAKLWSIAYTQVREPLELEAGRLREELAASQQEVHDSKALIEQLHAANERAVTQTRSMEAELTSATTALAQLREQAAGQIAELNRSIAARAIEHRDELRLVQDKHAAAVEASAQAHAQVVSDLNVRIQRLEQDAEQSKLDAAQELESAREDARAAAHQAEQARSDARDSAKRAESLLTGAEARAADALGRERAAKERLSQAEAAAQRAAGELDQARQEIERLVHQIQEELAKGLARPAGEEPSRSLPGPRRRK